MHSNKSDIHGDVKCEVSPKKLWKRDTAKNKAKVKSVEVEGRRKRTHPT